MLVGVGGLARLNNCDVGGNSLIKNQEVCHSDEERHGDKM